jgi:hypothetical protein
VACLSVPYLNNNFKSFNKHYIKLHITLKLSPNDLLKKIFPLFWQKSLPPIFFMEHLLQGLHGVDAPALFYQRLLRRAEGVLGWPY